MLLSTNFIINFRMYELLTYYLNHQILVIFYLNIIINYLSNIIQKLCHDEIIRSIKQTSNEYPKFLRYDHKRPRLNAFLQRRK
jgi:hypothetical protein